MGLLRTPTGLVVDTGGGLVAGSVPPPLTAATIKAGVQAFHDDFTKTGRQASGAGTVPTSGNIPSGTALSGNVLTVTGTGPGGAGITLEGFDLRGIRLDSQPGSKIGSLSHNTFDAAQSVGTHCIRALGDILDIGWNTFDGGSTLNAGSCIWGGVDRIHHNRFLNVSDDKIKPSGISGRTSLIDYNYFGVPKSWANARALWNSGATYAKNHVALQQSGGNFYTFVSKADGNTGHALPAHSAGYNASNTYWQEVNPHTDDIQLDGTLAGPLVVRRNYFDLRPSPYNYGLTTSVFIDPHQSPRTLDYLVQVYENILDASDLSPPGDGADYPRPLMTGGSGNIHNVVPEFFRNWMRHNGNYIYMGPTSAATTRYADNWRLVDDVQIPVNDPKVPSSGLVTFTPPAIGSVPW